MRLLCLLDKGDPPDHSFVTGMLAQVLPETERVEVHLIVASRTDVPCGPVVYHKATLWPILPSLPRRGVRKLKSAAIAMNFILRQARKTDHLVVFVRNDPLLLCAAGLLRPLVGKVVFQSSFPLENTHRSSVKRFLHRFLYRLGSMGADSYLAVSPRGLTRMRGYSRARAVGAYIPLLLDDNSMEALAHGRLNRPPVGPLKFIYVGAHDARRNLATVFAAIVDALEQRLDASFQFVGGSVEQASRIRAIEGVEKWVGEGRISIQPPLPRENVLRMLGSAHVGLSLVAPDALHREASPTKLAEYLGAGLSVMGSRGIDLQEQVIEESSAGVLVNFEREAIAKGLLDMAKAGSKMEDYWRNALIYAHRELTYASHVDRMRRILR